MRNSATAPRIGMLPALLVVVIVTSFLFGHLGTDCPSVASGPSAVASGHTTQSDAPSGDDDVCHCQHAAPAICRTHRVAAGHTAAAPVHSGVPDESCVDTGQATHRRR